MRKIWLNSRAISPVLSNLLLTVIAVSAMAIATASTYVISRNLRETMGERFIVEDVWFMQNNQIGLYIRNVGKVPLTIDRVYINHILQATTKLDLDPGQHGWLNITYAWSSGITYYIRITSKRGTKFADYYIAP